MTMRKPTFGDLTKTLPQADGSKFLLVNMIRLRAGQLRNGAIPLIDHSLVNANNPVSTSILEIDTGNIPFTFAEGTEAP